jgi:hypothetical protein
MPQRPTRGTPPQVPPMSLAQVVQEYGLAVALWTLHGQGYSGADAVVQLQKIGVPLAGIEVACQPFEETHP